MSAWITDLEFQGGDDSFCYSIDLQTVGAVCNRTGFQKQPRLQTVSFSKARAVANRTYDYPN